MQRTTPQVPANGEPLVTLDDIWAGYNGNTVLQGINLRLYQGDFLALVGANGTGKSTLALVVAGLLKPRRGRVTFAGRKRPRPGQDVTLLFQNAANQLFTDSVDEEVAFGPRNFNCFELSQHRRVCLLYTSDAADE